jgi:hypothetical protein
MPAVPALIHQEATPQAAWLLGFVRSPAEQRVFTEAQLVRHAVPSLTKHPHFSPHFNLRQWKTAPSLGPCLEDNEHRIHLSGLFIALMSKEIDLRKCQP